MRHTSVKKVDNGKMFQILDLSRLGNDNQPTSMQSDRIDAVVEKPSPWIVDF